jgi:monoamine oxidase
MPKSRRDFIKTVLATSALAPLTGCSALDQIFMGESRDESDKVVILGAGLAGLTAAYQLKKNQMQFRLFEASDRVGGRVQTVRDINISSRHGELGGERIDADHVSIQSLAQDLKIPLVETTLKESAAWFEKGKLMSSKDWRKETSDLVKLFQQIQLEAYGTTPQILNFQNKEQFPKAVLLDRMSAAELIDRLQSQMSPWMKPFLEQVIRSEWGVEPYQMSSLHLLHWMRDSFRPLGKKYFKIKGGSSVLTQALLDRVGGVVPQRFVKFRHQLQEIRELESGGWSLFFRTDTGRVEIKTKRIICTLPPTMLRQVEGWDRVVASPEKKKMIANQNLGTHGKILLSFQDRYWGDASMIGSGGTLYTDLPTSSITEGGDPVTTGLGSLHGVLQGQIGGDLGAQTGLHTVQQMLKDLGKMDPRASSYENINYVQNWKNFPWSRGSRSYLRPGQFQEFDLLHTGESWSFAGDSQSLVWMGTMNGAIQTALEAANRFLKTSG